MVEVLNVYHEWATGYYRRADGSITSEPANIYHVCRQANEIHAATLATEFVPVALKQVRQRMVGKGWSRGFINDQIDRLRRAFKWGVENELVPPVVYHALQAVQALSRGRTEAPDPAPVVPVPFDVVEKTLPHLSPR
jgi:hypothetical protein